MARLGVNIDHVATLRQARGGAEPDPIALAVLAEQAGADGIVVHLREDRRHIQDRDLRLLRQILQTKLDLEMAPIDEMVKIALEVRPDIVTLVPERREEKTTEGGLDVLAYRDRLQEVIGHLHEGGVVVSLFIEPDLEIVKAAHKLGADYIELHTGHYANARRASEEAAAVEAIQQSAKFAAKLNIGVNAGHGLTYRNVKRLAAMKEIVEFNIGHSIVARAVQVGMERAVTEMKELVK
jgi:pyridoxine 5-phosphate synthase